MVARTVAEFGTVDALALLAGRIPLTPLADIAEEEWVGVVISHLKGHFSLIQAAAPVMKEKGYRRIVGFSSMQGTIGEEDRLVGPSAKVAPLVAYLASEQAGWINGHAFDISESGRLGLYRPTVPERLIEQGGWFTVDEIGDAVVRLFEPMYSSEPRQRPRLLPPAGKELDRLPEGISHCCTKCSPRQGFSRLRRSRADAVAVMP